MLIMTAIANLTYDDVIFEMSSMEAVNTMDGTNDPSLVILVWF